MAWTPPHRFWRLCCFERTKLSVWKELDDEQFPLEPILPYRKPRTHDYELCFASMRGSSTRHVSLCLSDNQKVHLLIPALQSDDTMRAGHDKKSRYRDLQAGGNKRDNEY